MQNNNPNDYLQEDGADLKEIFKFLVNSKKLIIAITLVITTLGAIYSFQKLPLYKSTALIEIGNHKSTSLIEIGNYKTTPFASLIEPLSSLIQELNIRFIHKPTIIDFIPGNILLIPIENRLLEMQYTSPSPEKSKEVLNELVSFIENRHLNLQNNNTKEIENQLNYLITNLNKQIINIDSKIKALNLILEEDQYNLKLLKSNPELLIKRAAISPTLNQIIFVYKSKIIENKNQKIKLTQEKGTFELELESLTHQNPNSTRIIREIQTNIIEIKKVLIIFSSFFFGLFLSIILVLIYNSLKALIEE